MSYPLDSKTIALYDLDAGGGSLATVPGWNLTAHGDGTFSVAAINAHLFRLATEWTIEREVTITDAPGTILELGGYGETEPHNIQALVRWDEDRHLVVGWERGDGIDHAVRSYVPLPEGVPLRVAVVREGSGRVTIWANGVAIASQALPPPTGGGTIGGGPTPGMTLSVGRRVSTTDPEVYTGGGWLRISEVRTADEIRADWEASLSRPSAPSLAWEEKARQQGVQAYYVFRGRFRARDQVPGAAVEWGTHFVHRSDGGLIEQRLLELPAGITIGIPEAPGAMPERASGSIVVDNTDGALTTLFAGGVDPVAAHTGDSLLNLSGRIFLGLIGPDGVPEERAITPTLACAGSPTLDEHGRITIPLATDDTAILGAVQRKVTVDAVRRGEVIASGRLSSMTRRGGSLPAFGLNEFNEIRGRITESLDTTLPWAYGVAPVPLTWVGGRYLIAFISEHEPDLSWTDEWRLEHETRAEERSRLIKGRIRIWTIRLSVDIEDGSSTSVWVCGLTWSGDRTHYDKLFLTPAPRARVGLPPGIASTPATIAQRIVTDLSERGASGINSASFHEVAKALPLQNTCGGVAGLGGTVGEVLTHIGDPFGLSFWIDIDDRLHVMRATGWTVDDATAYAGSLPRIDAVDIIEGSYSERHPAVGELGGAALRSYVDWTGEQREFWGGRLLSQAPGVDRLALVGDREARISGAWVYPEETERALSSAASRRAYSYTRISLSTGLWMLGYSLGSLFRLVRPTDGQVRVVRLIRMTHEPGEAAVSCELLDMEGAARMRVGKLDSAQNWILFEPKEGTLTTQAGSKKIAVSPPFAQSDWVGASLWMHGASEPQLRGSWRIVAVAPDEIEISKEMPVSTSVDATPDTPATEAAWIIMRNRTHSPNHRPDYITLADAATGLHTDGSPGFRFSS